MPKERPIQRSMSWHSCIAFAGARNDYNSNPRSRVGRAIEHLKRRHVTGEPRTAPASGRYALAGLGSPERKEYRPTGVVKVFGGAVTLLVLAIVILLMILSQRRDRERLDIRLPRHVADSNAHLRR